MLKRLNQPVTLKSATQLFGLLLLVAAAGLGGRALWRWMHTGPKSPAQVKRDIHRFLKKQTGRSRFQPEFDFRLRETVAGLHTNAARLRAEINALHTNLARLQTEAAALRRDSLSAADQERTLRQEVRSLEADLAEKERRLTNRLGELSLMESNVHRATTNVSGLAREVASLQATNTALTNELNALQARIAALHARAADLQTDAGRLQAEAKNSQRQLAAKQKELSAREALPAARQKKTARQTNEAELPATPTPTNAAQLRDDLARLQTTVSNLTTDATARLDQAAALLKEATALQRQVAAKREALTALRHQLTNRQNDLAAQKNRLATAQTNLLSFRTNTFAFQSNVVALATQVSAKRDAWQTQQRQAATRDQALAAKQKEIATHQQLVQARQKEAHELQRTLQAKEQELATQPGRFRNDISRRVNQAQSYETIYTLIGQELVVADKLLAGPDPALQAQGLALALEAAQHAADTAQQAWLAARICEAYVVPNLARAENARGPYTPEGVLAQCHGIFERAEELPNVIKTCRLALERALTNAPVRADAARYRLALALERTGDLAEALKLYRAIEDTNQLRAAQQRIPIVESRLEQMRMAAK